MFNFYFNYYSISLLLGGIIAFISGLVVYLNNRKRPDNKAWILLTTCTSIWSFSYFAMISSPTKEIAFLANDILHIGAILIPVSYLLLVLYITKLWNSQKIGFWIVLAIAIFFIFIHKNDYFVSDIVQKVGFNFAPVPGRLYKYFFAYFVVGLVYGIILCLYKARKTLIKKERYRYYYIVFFTLAASIGGGSVFITTFNGFIPPYPLVLFSIYPLISGYGILRHQLFDTKIVQSQLVTFFLWMVILIRTFFSTSKFDLILNSALFLLSIFLGITLLKGVLKEIKIKDELAEKEVELTKKNSELARISAEKTEFVSLASHQIRGPLTSIKGYSAMLLDGDFGKLPKQAQEAARIMMDSCNTLVRVVNDYLDITRIEQGRMKYEFTDVDVRALIETCVKELTPSIERAKLVCKVDLPKPTGDTSSEWWHIKADGPKLKQVVLNLIDNAVKYTPSGSIHIHLFETVDKKIRLEIRDTGVGIAPLTMPKLFAKFSRAENASETNILGTGLGLYVAKMMVEAFEGKIWAESEGEGKGSTFIVELKEKRF